jgi:hypothetical protein
VASLQREIKDERDFSDKMIDEKMAKITLLEDKLDEEAKFNDYLIN